MLSWAITSHLIIDEEELTEGFRQDLEEKLTWKSLEFKQAEEHGQPTHDIDEWVELYDNPMDLFIVPRGFAPKLIEMMESRGYEYEFEDQRTFSPQKSIGNEIPLRSEQIKMRDAILEVEQGYVKSPTGSGKTVAGLAVADEIGKTLVIVNTMEIADQWIDRAKQWLGEDYPTGFIGDGKFEVSEYLTVATQQTLWSRREDLLLDGFFSAFNGVILDECFPAGTMIGGKPIESLEVGDLVPSYDEGIDGFVVRPVARTMKTRPRSMVRIHIKSGETIECTANHPFLTEDGWKDASDLSGYMVRYDPDHEISMRGVPSSSRNNHEIPSGQTQEARMGLLLEGVRQEVCCEGEQRDGIAHEQKVCVGANEEKEPDAPTGVAREDETHLAEDRSQASHQEREWNRNDGPRESLVRSDWVGSIDCEDPGSEERDSASAPLQSGPRGSKLETGDRDRRRQPLFSSSTRARRQEGRVFGWSRVDRVEILEPGSDGKFGGVCEDGLVYNIEVEETHTYLVNGLVSHNCHHGNARTYSKVMSSFDARYRWGFSATPEKTGDPRIMKAILGEQFLEITEHEVQASIIKPRIQVIPTKFSMKYKVHKGGGNNYQSILKAISEDQERNQLIVDEIMERHLDNANLVISKRTTHLSELWETLVASGYPEDKIYTIVGQDSRSERAEANAAAGHGGCVVLSTLADEALDIPRLDRVHLTFPTKNPGLVKQQIGRIRRKHPDKDDAIVLDYHDWQTTVLHKQYMTRRHQVYNKMGWNVKKRKKKL